MQGASVAVWHRVRCGWACTVLAQATAGNAVHQVANSTAAAAAVVNCRLEDFWNSTGQPAGVQALLRNAGLDASAPIVGSAVAAIANCPATHWQVWFMPRLVFDPLLLCILAVNLLQFTGGTLALLLASNSQQVETHLRWQSAVCVSTGCAHSAWLVVARRCSWRALAQLSRTRCLRLILTQKILWQHLATSR